MDILFMLLAIMCLGWAVTGLVMPGQSLFFARPEKRTRFYAFLYPVFCAFFFFSCFLFYLPDDSGSWIFFGFTLFCVLGGGFNLLSPSSAMQQKPAKNTNAERSPEEPSRVLSVSFDTSSVLSPTERAEIDRIFERRDEAEKMGLYDLKMDELHAIAKKLGVFLRDNKIDRIDSIMEKDTESIMQAMREIKKN